MKPTSSNTTAIKESNQGYLVAGVIGLRATRAWRFEGEGFFAHNGVDNFIVDSQTVTGIAYQMHKDIFLTMDCRYIGTPTGDFLLTNSSGQTNSIREKYRNVVIHFGFMAFFR